MRADRTVDEAIALQQAWQNEKREPVRVLQSWIDHLPLQQQAVLLMACRGPDGYEKFHPCKDVVRALRGCVLMAAYYGRPLRIGEKADTYMDMGPIGGLENEWTNVIRQWACVEDGLPIHFYQHMMQAANVLRFSHPEPLICGRWALFYYHCCDYLHVMPETEAGFRARLNDWGRKAWGDESHAPEVIAAAKNDDFMQKVEE